MRSPNHAHICTPCFLACLTRILKGKEIACNKRRLEHGEWIESIELRFHDFHVKSLKQSGTACFCFSMSTEELLPFWTWITSLAYNPPHSKCLGGRRAAPHTHTHTQACCALTCVHTNRSVIHTHMLYWIYWHILSVYNHIQSYFYHHESCIIMLYLSIYDVHNGSFHFMVALMLHSC